MTVESETRPKLVDLWTNRAILVATGHKNINLKVRNGTSEPVNQ